MMKNQTSKKTIIVTLLGIAISACTLSANSEVMISNCFYVEQPQGMEINNKIPKNHMEALFPTDGSNDN